MNFQELQREYGMRYHIAHQEWIAGPPGVQEVMGSISVGTQIFFLYHVDQFIFHTSLSFLLDFISF